MLVVINENLNGQSLKPNKSQGDNLILKDLQSTYMSLSAEAIVAIIATVVGIPPMIIAISTWIKGRTPPPISQRKIPLTLR